MGDIQTLLAGSQNFALYFLVSLALLGIFVGLYSLITPYREIGLIRSGNRAAAWSLGGAIVGFVIPIAKAVAQSESLPDMVVWAAIAFVAQVAAYGVAAILVPQLRKTIASDQEASGILLAALSVAIGILNAACMSA